MRATCMLGRRCDGAAAERAQERAPGARGRAWRRSGARAARPQLGEDPVARGGRRRAPVLALPAPSVGGGVERAGEVDARAFGSVAKAELRLRRTRQRSARRVSSPGARRVRRCTVLGLGLELAGPQVQRERVLVEVQRGALQRRGAERGVQAHVHEPDALGLRCRSLRAAASAGATCAARGSSPTRRRLPNGSRCGEVLVGVGRAGPADQRLLGGAEHAELDQPPPRLEQVVPAQHARAPLARSATPPRLSSATRWPLRRAQRRADLALEQHDELGVEAQHAVEALAAIGVARPRGSAPRGSESGVRNTLTSRSRWTSPSAALFLGGVDDVVACRSTVQSGSWLSERSPISRSSVSRASGTSRSTIIAARVSWSSWPRARSA